MCVCVFVCVRVRVYTDVGSNKKDFKMRKDEKDFCLILFCYYIHKKRYYVINSEHYKKLFHSYFSV